MEPMQSTDWHLTPRGWEKGTEIIPEQEVKEVPPPKDRVLTMRVSPRPVGVTFRAPRTQEIYRSKNDELVASLLRSYGPIEQTLN